MKRQVHATIAANPARQADIRASWQCPRGGAPVSVIEPSIHEVEPTPAEEAAP